MHGKKVSIIIPAYNAEQYLMRCLDSVCAQTYTNLEILLVDDGSTDATNDICREYSRRDSRIILHSQENLGVSVARNWALDRATGDYVAFADADDYLELNMVERMVTTAEEHAVDMVVCSFFEETGNTVRKHCFAMQSAARTGGYYNQEECHLLALDLIDNNTRTRIPPYSWIRMVRREIFDDVKLRYNVRIKRSEDYLLWTQVHFCIKSMYLMEEAHLYHYMHNSASITRSYLPNYWKMCKLIYAELNENLPNDKEIRKKIQAMLIQRSLIALHNAREADCAQFEKDLQEVLNDKELIRAAWSVGIIKNSKRAKVYALLVMLRFKFLIKKFILKKA